MKIISHIFIFYLLLNTTVPCYIYSDCCVEELQSSMISINESHTEAECESCSPMFQCSDCIASFITSSFKVEIKLKSLNTVSPQPYIKNIPIEPNGIWQPPKA